MATPIPAPTRRVLLSGAAAGLASLALAPSPVWAQAGGYDDNRLYKDQYGQLYRKRSGQYVPYGGAVRSGRPVDGPGADLDPAEAARRQAQQYGASPEAAPPARAAKRQDGYPIPPQAPDNAPIDHARAYAGLSDGPFSVPAIPYRKYNPAFLRQEVAYPTSQPPGTIVVDPRGHFLYLVEGNGRARRYGVGVGKQGFSWNGAATINSKQAWPDWYPPPEMIARRPDLRGQVSKLQSGVGVPGGSGNPLGARAMYLWQNNKDTLFRIHGTNEPQSIGKSVSSGCIRMINQDAIDLFNRVDVGTRVVVL